MLGDEVRHAGQHRASRNSSIVTTCLDNMLDQLSMLNQFDELGSAGSFLQYPSVVQLGAAYLGYMHRLEAAEVHRRARRARRLSHRHGRLRWPGPRSRHARLGPRCRRAHGGRQPASTAILGLYAVMTSG